MTDMGVDVAVDGPLDADQQALASSEHVRGRTGELAGTPTSPYPLSLLSPTQLADLKTVSLFRQITTSQLRRLHYFGTTRGTKVRVHRHLQRLERLGLVIKLPPPTGGYGGGSGEAVYMPAGSKARVMDMHTLDIAEMRVRLAESGAAISAFDPEPWCHVKVGQMELKPDAFVDVGRRRYWLEMDRGTEYRAQLAFKMGRYVRAYEQWDERVFPFVLWVCHDSDRKRFIESVIKRQSVRGLFIVALFDEAVAHIAK